MAFEAGKSWPGLSRVDNYSTTLANTHYVFEQYSAFFYTLSHSILTLSLWKTLMFSLWPSNSPNENSCLCVPLALFSKPFFIAHLWEVHMEGHVCSFCLPNYTLKTVKTAYACESKYLCSNVQVQMPNPIWTVVWGWPRYWPPWASISLSEIRSPTSKGCWET